MIAANNWRLLHKFKEEAETYESYISQITKDKIDLAKSILDEKDDQILELVSKLKICTANQIAKFIWSECKMKNANQNANNRIKKLYRLGCIDRFFPAPEGGTGSQSTHIVLGPIGARMLKLKGFRRIRSLNQNWRHTVMISEVIANFHNKYDLLIWKKEIKLNWKDEIDRDFLQQSDVLIGYKNSKGQEKWALIEADMGTEDLQTLLVKVKNYISYFNSSYFKKDYWQPHLHKEISIIPEIFFIMKYDKDGIALKNKINKIESNISFKVFSLNQIKA